MAEENVNNNVPETGDVLGQVPGSVSEPRSLKDISRAVASIDSTTQQLNRSFMRFISDNARTSTGNFAARFEDESYNRKQSSRSSSSKSRSSFSSSTKHKSQSALDDFLNGFEEQLAEQLGVPYIGDDVEESVRGALDSWVQKFSKVVNIPQEDLAREFGKKLSKSVLSNFDTNYGWISDKVKNVVGWYRDGLTNYLEGVADKVDRTSGADWSARMKRVNVEVDERFAAQQAAKDEEERQKRYNAESEYDNKQQQEAKKKLAAGVTSIKNLVVENAVISSVLYTDESSVSKVFNALYENEDTSASSSKSSIFSDTVKDTILEKTGTKSALDKVSGTIMDAGTQFLATGDVKALTSVLSGVAGGLTKLVPQLVVAAVAFSAVEAFTAKLGQIAERFSKGFEKLTSSYDKVDEMRWANVEAQEERMLKDVETYIKHPFDVLEDAANKVYEVWDSALQTITATQGYDKSGLQDLMSAYASRLREEGLSDVVGTTDVTAMLQEILNAGLSGDVAEEFAYQATVLKKAIPTEDFTSYASSYASLVSSYMSAGHSQAEALSYATSQLKIFASSVLTASREVSGGLTTSLTGVSSLFDDIVKISQTAGVSDTSSLSSALSVVQAVAGQVSPDVGNALVSQIVEAAVGGNSSELVALRSLANTGASNTAFLQALAKDPSSVLATLFSSLDDMFDKTTDNYMEVAYSLADTFGISADSLARVNWDKLVDELRTNSAGTSALNQNMSLLQSGETTTSAESQRLAQINEYMINEGLSYVLDNEAARQIQQHMWDQEIAAEMKEATYAVDFAGGALELMTTVSSILSSIANFLTLGFANIGNIIDSGMDYSNILSDIKTLLKVGNVGEGNAQAYHDLTTYDVNSLSYNKNEMDLWGQNSKYYGTSSYTANQAANNITSQYFAAASNPDSKYSWTSSGKSALSDFGSTTYSASSSTSSAVSQASDTSSVTDTISNQTANMLADWLDSMSSYIEQRQSFSDWWNSASEYGFSDVGSTLETLGYTQQDLQNAYLDQATDYAVDEQLVANQVESQMYQQVLTFLTSTYPTDRDNWNAKYDTNTASWNTTFSNAVASWNELYTSTMQTFTEHFDLKMSEWSTLYEEYAYDTNKKLQYGNNAFDENFVNDFLYEWKDYYIGNHTHYREATNFDASLRTINTERSQTGEAVLALAQTLTKNYEDLADPQVQTNVLLGQIVIILQSILTAQQSGNGLTLPTALAALGLNITDTKS